MTTSIFDNALAYVLANEGGYNNVSGDQPTNFGITQTTLASWRHAPVTIEDVKRLQMSEVRAIYEAWYWKPTRCPEIKNANIATALFDQAVNRGPVTATKMLQLALGFQQTGHLTNAQLQNMDDRGSVDVLVKYIPVIQDSYIARVIASPSKMKFLAGWMNRSQRLMELMI